MIAYKFLGDARVAPFTGFQWPEGEWIAVDEVTPCVSGIHACRIEHLPFWLDRELWEVELDGDIVERPRKVVGSRGRLTRRIEAWNGAVASEFAATLVARARRRFGSIPIISGFVVDIERFRATDRVPLAAFAAARAAEMSGGPRAYEQERERQARWIARRLGLS